MSQSVPVSLSAPAADLSVSGLVEVEGLKQQLEERLTAVLAEQRGQLTAISSDSDLLIDAWAPMLMGGKRLRAAFAYWAWRAYGGQAQAANRSGVIQVCAALEMFQAAALFHDDVMDRSDTRRGIPTAHRSFAQTHLDEKLHGDADQYGLSAAILLGDLSLIASENEFRAGAATFPAAQGFEAHKHFDAMRTVVTVGQFLDVHAQVAQWEEDLTGAEARSLTVIETKTASYSVNSPLQIGASLAGAPAEEHEKLRSFGIPVGMAYQLVDDLLGIFGDPEVTGKPAGDDLREGKRTVLVIEALRALAPQDRATLQDSLGNSDLTDDQVTNLIALIKSSGAVQATQRRIDELTTQGLNALVSLDINQPGREFLEQLTALALRRKF